MNLEKMRDEKTGKLPAYAWPGGYPIFYLAKDNGVLCPDCANSYKPGRDNGEQLEPIAAEINWEDSLLCCDNCNMEIGAAYEVGE